MRTHISTGLIIGLLLSSASTLAVAQAVDAPVIDSTIDPYAVQEEVIIDPAPAETITDQDYVPSVPAPTETALPDQNGYIPSVPAPTYAPEAEADIIVETNDDMDPAYGAYREETAPYAEEELVPSSAEESVMETETAPTETPQPPAAPAEQPLPWLQENATPQQEPEYDPDSTARIEPGIDDIPADTGAPTDTGYIPSVPAPAYVPEPEEETPVYDVTPTEEPAIEPPVAAEPSAYWNGVENGYVPSVPAPAYVPEAEPEPVAEPVREITPEPVYTPTEEPAQVEPPSPAAEPAPPASQVSIPVSSTPLVTDNTPLVLVLDGEGYTQADIEKEVENTAPKGSKPVDYDELTPSVRRNLVRAVARRHLLLRDAGREHLEDDPAVQEKLYFMRMQVLLDTYVERLLARLIPESAVDREYQAVVSALRGEQEVHARHILVDTAEEAIEIVKLLRNGANFAMLAEERSRDPGTRKTGGDLGYFTRNQMVPSFGEAAFSLKIGELSAPVKTEFGWHIIKLEDKRALEIPTKEELRDRIMAKLAGPVLDDYFRTLVDKADVTYYSPEGAPEPLFSGE